MKIVFLRMLDFEVICVITKTQFFLILIFSDSYEDSLKNMKVCRRTSLPKNSAFRRSLQINAVGSRGIRHSFSGIEINHLRSHENALLTELGLMLGSLAY